MIRYTLFFLTINSNEFVNKLGIFYKIVKFFSYWQAFAKTEIQLPE